MRTYSLYPCCDRVCYFTVDPNEKTEIFYRDCPQCNRVYEVVKRMNKTFYEIVNGVPVENRNLSVQMMTMNWYEIKQL